MKRHTAYFYNALILPTASSVVWNIKWRHVYVTYKINKQTAYVQRAFVPVSSYVKVTKIHQDFPELWSQMDCSGRFLWDTVYMSIGWRAIHAGLSCWHASSSSSLPSFLSINVLSTLSHWRSSLTHPPARWGLLSRRDLCRSLHAQT